MLKLTWEQMNEPTFVSAIVKLSQNRELEQKTAYRVGRIFAVARREMERLREVELKLRENYALRDGDGKPQTTNEGEFIVAPENMEKYDADFKKAVSEKSVEIKVHKIDFAAIKGLSGQELVAIEEIVDGCPEA